MSASLPAGCQDVPKPPPRHVNLKPPHQGISSTASLTATVETSCGAFRVALDACHEQGFVDSDDGAARLRRRMVERVLTHCETDRGATEPLMVLLRRFATESAREEARLFCDELVADDAIGPIYDDLIAA